jgi:hypothetical protein
MDVDSYLRTLTRAESLTGSGRWAEAAALWRQVTDLNPVNGNHQDRLAQACFESGDYPSPLRPPRRPLNSASGIAVKSAIRPSRASWSTASRAAMPASATRSGPSPSWSALRAGLRDLDRLRADPTWQPLLGHERFRVMLDIDVSALSRDEGWRRDLQLLGREVKRRAYDPFRHFSEHDFDTMLAGLGHRVPELSDAQILAGILKLLRHLGDGHAGIAGPADYQVKTGAARWLRHPPSCTPWT